MNVLAQASVHRRQRLGAHEAGGLGEGTAAESAESLARDSEHDEGIERKTVGRCVAIEQSRRCSGWKGPRVTNETFKVRSSDQAVQAASVLPSEHRSATPPSPLT